MTKKLSKSSLQSSSHNQNKKKLTRPDEDIVSTPIQNVDLFDRFIPGFLDLFPISDQIKLFYATIRNLVQLKGYCWMTNENLALRHRVTPRRIQQWLVILKNCDLIECYYFIPENGFSKIRHIYLTEVQRARRLMADPIQKQRIQKNSNHEHRSIKREKRSSNSEKIPCGNVHNSKPDFDPYFRFSETIQKFLNHEISFRGGRNLFQGGVKFISCKSYKQNIKKAASPPTPQTLEKPPDPDPKPQKIAAEFAAAASLKNRVKEEFDSLSEYEQHLILDLYKKRNAQKPIANFQAWICSCIKEGWHLEEKIPEGAPEESSEAKEKKKNVDLSMHVIKALECRSDVYILLLSDVLCVKVSEDYSRTIVLQQGSFEFLQQLKKILREAKIDLDFYLRLQKSG
jgi:hypothetical protein